MFTLRPVLATLALLLLSEGTAWAQGLEPSLDIRTWRPSTDPAASLVLEPTSSPGPWNWNVDAWLSYANRPVGLRIPGNPGTLHPIENLVAGDLTASLGLGSRASVGFDLPMVLYQQGSAGLPTSAVTSGRVPETALGDVGVTGKGTILTNEDGGFGLAVLGGVTVPTGDRESFMSQGSATVNARLLADYSLVVVSFQASAGYELVTQHHTWLGVRFGDALPWSFGMLLHPGVVRALDNGDRQSWEVALHGAIPANPGDPGSQARSPVLLALSDRIALGHFRDAYVLLGADIGLTDAIGVPTVRAIASIGWAPRTHDKDRDGVPDDVDQCPDIPEDLDGFEDNDGCPDVDDDDDGIPDKEDACPQVKGVPDPDPKKNGCPRPEAKDSDHDDIYDPADKCPDQPEDKDGFQDLDGCPEPDNDGDGIADADDACPNVPGEASSDPTMNGCPNLDHDGDTFDDAVDKCPADPEVWNGVKDDDGCPDVGGKPLATVDTKDPRLPVRLASPIQFSGAALTVDAASTPTVRALAQILNAHHDWTLAVGVRPGATVSPEGAMDRSAAVVRQLAAFTHRDGVAEPVAWTAVAAQPGSDSGMAFLVLVGERTKRPVKLRPAP